MTAVVVYVVFPLAFGGTAWAARKLAHHAQAKGKQGQETAFWAGVGARAAWVMLVVTEVFCLPFHLDLLFAHQVEAQLTERTVVFSGGESRQAQQMTDQQANQYLISPEARCRPNANGVGQVCDVPVTTSNATVHAKLVWVEEGQPRTHDIELGGIHESLAEGSTVFALVGVGNPTIGTEPRLPGCSVVMGVGLLAALLAWLGRLRWLDSKQ